MVSKLDKHEWDEDCSFCMANPWLKETKQIADYLPKLIDEEQQILFDIDDFCMHECISTKSDLFKLQWKFNLKI